VNQVFIEASKHVATDFQWSPFQDYVFSQMTDLLGQASQGKLGFGDVPRKLQDNLVSYANSQGFKAAGA
jgi:multiple sugar transport system substrate-binding protein